MSYFEVNFSQFSIHVSVFNLFWNHSMSRWLFTYTSKATWNCLGNITGLFSILFFYSATFLGGFNLTHITYSIFLFVKWREEEKVKFPLWAVSMLGCSWPRTFRNFSIKEGGTTCSKWASYLSILRSLVKQELLEYQDIKSDTKEFPKIIFHSY